MSKILGGQMLSDVQTFVAALDTMFGGFRERADQTYALLPSAGTAFLVVAAPERDALREASFFVDRLEADGMPLTGLVVNRMARLGRAALTPHGRWPSPRRSRTAGDGPKTARHDRGPAPPARRPRASAERQRELAERFPRATPACRSCRCRPRPRTSTTWTACARSGTAAGPRRDPPSKSVPMSAPPGAQDPETRVRR